MNTLNELADSFDAWINNVALPTCANLKGKEQIAGPFFLEHVNEMSRALRNIANMIPVASEEIVSRAINNHRSRTKARDTTEAEAMILRSPNHVAGASL